MKRDFPNILISFVFGVMTLILGSVLLMAIEPQFSSELVQAVPEKVWSDEIHISGVAPAVVFSGGVHENWLRVERCNKTDSKAQGFDPCHTQLQSDFLPVVRKVGTKYEIAFVSDIGKDDLP